MLADGRLTLTAASKLGPHLTAENATALLERAVHATRRQVEVLVAELAPQPDAPSSLRRLPAPRQPASVAEVRSAAESPAAEGDAGADTAVEVRPATDQVDLPPVHRGSASRSWRSCSRVGARI